MTSTCPKGTYKNDILCEDCQSPCSECINDPNTCTRCPNNMYLHNSKCIESCPEDYYSYDDLCIANCPKKTFINGNKCVDECPKGKFGINHYCNDCDQSCGSCENLSTLCTTCKTDNFLYKNQCLTSCAEGTLIYQDKCVDECPPDSYLSGNTCLEEIDIIYDSPEEIHTKVPRASKTIIIAFLTILVFAFVAEIIILVFIIICN